VLVALAAGLLLGLALGTVGGGGAVLAVPVLVFLLGHSVHAATTESLVIVLAAAAAGAAGHARHGLSCWRIAAAFVAAAVPGSLVGTQVNAVVPARGLLGAFAVLLLVVAALTWRRGTAVTEIDGACPAIDVRFVVAAGLLTGVLTGLFGVGGGFAVVPALALGLGVPFRRAIATSLVVVTAVSSIALAEHVAKGSEIDWRIVLPFAAAAVATASLGGTIARRLPRRTLAHGFALLLAGIASYLVVSVTLLGGTPHS
jgi:uncharacterized protein